MNLPRMAVMQIRNVFRRKTKHAAQECTGRTFLGVPAGVFCTRLAFAELPRMAVVLYRSEIWAMHKSRRSEVYTDVHF